MEVIININYSDDDNDSTKVYVVKNLVNKAVKEISEVIPTSCCGYRSVIVHNDKDFGYVELIR